MPTDEMRITGITQDPATGWYRAPTDHPTVKRLDTREAEHARQLQELMQSGETVVIDYNHVQKPRPGGGVYNNYYFNQVVARAKQPALPDIPLESARPTDKGDAWRICLSLGAKLALETLPLMEKAEDKTFPAQTDLAYAWGYWLYTTPQPDPNANTPAPASNGPNPGAYGNYIPSAGDEDIPF